METSFSIKARDGKQIYGFIHRPAEATDSVVILVHGLTGHMNEHIHIDLAQHFSRRGYAAIRYNQYGDGKNARVFCETTISMHVSDTLEDNKFRDCRRKRWAVEIMDRSSVA